MLGMVYPNAAQAASVLVTNTDDAGQGSLRQAITFANQNRGTVIRFQIPRNAAGLFVIRPQTILPAVTASNTVIDGNSQTAFTGNTNPTGPEVMLSGSLTTQAGSGLRLNASNCLVRGLIINGFPWDGITINGTTAQNNRVQGCFIGTDQSGNNAVPNKSFGISTFGGARGNVIGGYALTERNVISGNAWAGISFQGSGTNGNFVAGNILGLNAAGTRPVPNLGDGVVIYGSAQNNTIGGLRVGARNILSGNRRDGIHIADAGSTGNIVQGNYIGTTLTGRSAAGNAGSGIGIQDGPQNNLIGGAVVAARNVISGNVDGGVVILSAQSDNNRVQGNFIGTDASGTMALGNYRGVYIFNGAANNVIGGTSPATRNVISGNRWHGVDIWNNATRNLVQGNFIGTDVRGVRPIPNGQSGVGFFDAIGNTVGGPRGSNRIAFNNGDGVLVAILTGTCTGNTIRGNEIFSNGGLGINLKPATEPDRTVTRNDSRDSDEGPNRLQNFPVLTSATISGNRITTISGTLNSGTNPSGSYYTLDFYRSTAADPSGYGEGQTYLGSKNVITDTDGNVAFSFSVYNNATGQSYTVTATNSSTGDTSEFSNVVRSTSIQMLSISGSVQTSENGEQSVGVTNAAITLQDSSGRTTSTRTNSNGQYVFSGLTAGIYTVRPQLTGYVFGPADRTVTITTTPIAGINFTASRTISISGRVVTSTGTGVANVRIVHSGGTMPVWTDANGYYIINDLKAGTYTLTPDKSGYTFSPPSRTVTISASVAINFVAS